MTDSPPDRDGPSGPTKSPKSAAKRMRDRYWRCKTQKQSLRTDYTKEYLAELVNDGWITADDLNDPGKLGAAIEDRDDTQKRGTFQAGPIVVTGTSTNS